MNLTRDHKVCAYVFGVLQRLHELGMISKMDFVTPKGTGVFDQVLASGFQPTEEEILMVLTAAQKRKLLKFRNDFDKDVVKTLVVEYRPATPH